MSNDRTVKFTLRLNMLNPVHVNINKVLSELDMDIFKSKNQLFIYAATYYIEHFGLEALTEPKEKKEPQFISTEEMAVIEERIRQEAREEARQEANKEVMNMICIVKSNTWWYAIRNRRCILWQQKLQM